MQILRTLTRLEIQTFYSNTVWHDVYNRLLFAELVINNAVTILFDCIAAR